MRKENMLVVEDEEIMRDALVDYFSSEGHKVDTAPDGDKALEKLNLKDYNVMIIDLRLPGRDGLEVLDEIRAKNPDAKVIIITAYPTVDSETKALEKGAVNYLQKPFELDYLETLIKQSYEIDVTPAPPVEEPVFEEEIIAPCIWMQAGIVKKRACTLGYQCQRVCNFHAQLMEKEKFRNDPRIQPYLEKLTAQSGTHQCRYVMSGEISTRSCSQLYQCEHCELHQTIQDEIDRQRVLKAEHKKRMQEKQFRQAPVMDKSERQDH
ncbi:MAG: response regulator [Candidatus Aminicenantes bacterium]|jgi:CheY-like chemotaxis protein